MDNIVVAIVTNDREYGRAISLAMLSICKSFIIKLHTPEEYFRKRSGADLILWDGEEVRSVYGGKIIYLAEKASDAVKDMSGKRFCIYKYSTAACIVACIFEAYGAVTGRQAVNLKRKDVRLFAFVSPSGGTGCSSMAMALGQELSRFRGKRVLYLSFEEIESTGFFIPYSIGLKGVGVYLYHLFKNEFSLMDEATDEAQHPFLDEYVIRDDFGMEAFVPTQGRNPLRELKSYEINKFMEALMDSNRYDVIIFDMGNWLSGVSISCMDMAEKICFVISEDGDTLRAKQYLGHIIGLCGESALDKFVKVVNMKSDTTREARWVTEYLPDSSINVSCCRSVVREGQVKKLLLEGAYGSEIKMFADQILKN